MSTQQSTPDASSPIPRQQQQKPHRAAACTLCHSRKVKCDRKTPCANCIKARAECVPATVARRRPRRRLPEQELLDRLRRYEGLLQANNIKFETPQEAASREKTSPLAHDGEVSDDDQPAEAVGTDSPSSSVVSKARDPLQYEAKSFWHTIGGTHDEDQDDENSLVSNEEVRTATIRQAWGQTSGDSIFLMLGSRYTPISVSSLHPEPVKLFRLWQTFLENVNPLVKVVHAPTMQGRIIEAASNLEGINPVLEALMFSIYCMAVASLSIEECQTMFNSPKSDLLNKFQAACQQALLNCKFLSTLERDCLTALFLYLMSVGTITDPFSLATVLGISHRIARRLGIDCEPGATRCSPLEAEMRRRLWWSLTLFDGRITEMGHTRSMTLDPTWNCKVPVNVYDSDLREEMKEAPAAQAYPTDSIFAVVRSELGDFIRHSSYHLDFINPALKGIAREHRLDVAPGNDDLDALEKKIQEKYLKFCDPGIPLHLITICTTGIFLAKYRLVKYYVDLSDKPQSSATDPQQMEESIIHSIRRLDYDTQIMVSPLLKGYRWFASFHFQFPAYVHIAHLLKRNPSSGHAEAAWDAMSNNLEARFADTTSHFAESPLQYMPLVKLLVKTVLPAWDAYQKSVSSNAQPTPPRVVVLIKEQMEAMQRQADPEPDVKQAQQEPAGTTGWDQMDFTTMPIPMGFGADNFLLDMGMGGIDTFAGSGADAFAPLSEQTPADVGMDQMNWAAMRWGLNERPGW